MTALPECYPVDILLPKAWWGTVKYRMQETMTIAGVSIPRGFTSDGATVPRLFWIIFPPVCQYFPAALVHDHLLKSGVGWKVANRHFKRALIEHTIPKWRRILMCVAVGAYGIYRDMIDPA